MRLGGFLETPWVWERRYHVFCHQLLARKESWHQLSHRSKAKPLKALVGIFKSSVALKREEYHTSLFVYVFGMVLRLTISAADLIVGCGCLCDGTGDKSPKLF
jgi:hypothetical protein